MAYDRQKDETLYAKAEALHSWHSLIGYPPLLFRWQTKHANSVKEIAAISSHKLEKHKWCTDTKVCEGFDTLIRENAPTSLFK